MISIEEIRVLDAGNIYDAHTHARTRESRNYESCSLIPQSYFLALDAIEIKTGYTFWGLCERAKEEQDRRSAESVTATNGDG